MKRKLLLTTTVLSIGLFAVALPARADGFGVQFGVAGGNGYVRLSYDARGRGSKHEGGVKPRPTHRHFRNDHGRYTRTVVNGRSFRYGVHPRRVVHTCVYVPVYRKVWVAPVCATVFDGRDACGRPRYRSVVVRPGYYRNVLSHYACKCGAERPRHGH